MGDGVLRVLLVLGALEERAEGGALLGHEPEGGGEEGADGGDHIDRTERHQLKSSMFTIMQCSETEEILKARTPAL